MKYLREQSSPKREGGRIHRTEGAFKPNEKWEFSLRWIFAGDLRFNFSHSDMIVYFAVWNAYNRANVANYYWNEIEKKQDEMLQWSMLPIFGVEFEF